jgi:hypothetical protein
MANKNANPAPVVLTIDDGAKRYEIKNQFGEVVGEYTITPTDFGLYERFAHMQDELEAITKPLEALDADADMGRFVEATEAIKGRLYAAIDKMFGSEGMAERLFGRLHPFTPVNGRFYFDRVMEAVGAQINATFEAEAKAFSENVKKYTEAVKK